MWAITLHGMYEFSILLAKQYVKSIYNILDMAWECVVWE